MGIPDLREHLIACTHQAFFVRIVLEQYAQKMLDEYTQLDVPANQVYPQSFNLDDVKYWINTNPEFANSGLVLIQYLTSSKLNDCGYT